MEYEKCISSLQKSVEGHLCKGQRHQTLAPLLPGWTGSDISNLVQYSGTLLHAVALFVAAKCTAWSSPCCSGASVSLLKAEASELEVQR